MALVAVGEDAAVKVNIRLARPAYSGGKNADHGPEKTHCGLRAGWQGDAATRCVEQTALGLGFRQLQRLPWKPSCGLYGDHLRSRRPLRSQGWQAEILLVAAMRTLNSWAKKNHP